VIKMARYKIAWLPGDGIGKDVSQAARIVLDKLKFDAEYIPGDVGWEFWCREGNPLPERTISILKNTDACFFGAITSKPKEECEAELISSLKGKGYKYTSPIVKMRQMLNLYVNIRPCIALPGNPTNFRDDINLVIFRENTEDLYSGVEFYPVPEDMMNYLVEHHSKMKRFEETPLDEIAIGLRINTVRASSRVLEAAFKFAVEKGYKSVTLVEKPNVLRETSGLVVREARKMAREFPHIELKEVNVDAMCMWLLKKPTEYGVIVSTNMFGDIISDLCAQLIGGLGFAYSGNIGDNYAVFEPVHGSAPKYAGLYKVNPCAAIMAAKYMLEWLGEKDEAFRIERAVKKVIREGKVRTYDMGGNASTIDMANEISSKL